MSCADFMGNLFLARDVAHSVHLSTRSFAKHSALDGFYHGIIDLADKFAEAYQGRHGLIGPIPIKGAKKATNIVEFLEDSLAGVEADRHEVCDGGGTKDSALQNIVDEIVGLYLSTLYKLKHLS